MLWARLPMFAELKGARDLKSSVSEGEILMSRVLGQGHWSIKGVAWVVLKLSEQDRDPSTTPGLLSCLALWLRVSCWIHVGFSLLLQNEAEIRNL